MIVVWVWLMWTAAYVVVTVLAPSVGAALKVAGTPDGKAVAKKAGDAFDRRFPPVDEPADG